MKFQGLVLASICCFSAAISGVYAASAIDNNENIDDVSSQSYLEADLLLRPRAAALSAPPFLSPRPIITPGRIIAAGAEEEEEAAEEEEDFALIERELVRGQATSLRNVMLSSVAASLIGALSFYLSGLYLNHFKADELLAKIDLKDAAWDGALTALTNFWVFSFSLLQSLSASSSSSSSLSSKSRLQGVGALAFGIAGAASNERVGVDAIKGLLTAFLSRILSVHFVANNVVPSAVAARRRGHQGGGLLTSSTFVRQLLTYLTTVVIGSVISAYALGYDPVVAAIFGIVGLPETQGVFNQLAAFKN